MKKTFAITALTLAFGLMFTTSKADAGFRIRIGSGGVRFNYHSHGHDHNHHHGYYEYVDGLAVRLERESKSLLREVHAHFRGTPQYRHLDRDVHEIVDLAEHIHDVAHGHGNRAHIAADVRKLDRVFHHVEDLVGKMRFCRGLNFRAYRHLRYELSHMERTLHTLARAVR